jgi:hypothetical protein
MRKILKKSRIGFVLWRDALYSDKKRFLPIPPDLEVTFGLIDSSNKDFIKVGMNCSYDKKSNSFKIIDGMLIPRGAVKEIKYFNEQI